jgi:hypothetical protein
MSSTAWILHRQAAGPGQGNEFRPNADLAPLPPVVVAAESAISDVTDPRGFALDLAGDHRFMPGEPMK